MCSYPYHHIKIHTCLHKKDWCNGAGYYLLKMHNTFFCIYLNSMKAKNAQRSSSCLCPGHNTLSFFPGFIKVWCTQKCQHALQQGAPKAQSTISFTWWYHSFIFDISTVIHISNSYSIDFNTNTSSNTQQWFELPHVLMIYDLIGQYTLKLTKYPP